MVGGHSYYGLTEADVRRIAREEIAAERDERHARFMKSIGAATQEHRLLCRQAEQGGGGDA